jgi:hypothetical protein
MVCAVMREWAGKKDELIKPCIVRKLDRLSRRVKNVNYERHVGHQERVTMHSDVDVHVCVCVCARKTTADATHTSSPDGQKSYGEHVGAKGFGCPRRNCVPLVFRRVRDCRKRMHEQPLEFACTFVSVAEECASRLIITGGGGGGASLAASIKGLRLDYGSTSRESPLV